MIRENWAPFLGETNYNKNNKRIQSKIYWFSIAVWATSHIVLFYVSAQLVAIADQRYFINAYCNGWAWMDMDEPIFFNIEQHKGSLLA